ncbi:hypothetical protein HPB48_022722 [Haemaphysalis longicornis]|uniref:ABC transporter n=1 Tax=Haemaphysalis longicornis TaxID=44386 RepID=A0A9J6FSW7_HAELO|nr:hypothetical protein HPB48_022722 [Haemaphysalis longicornis]
MLRRLLFSPVSFFDSTPRGRVLNRFSADLDRVDSRLYLITKEVLQTLTVSVARLAVVGTQAPLACGLGVVATAVYVAVVAVTVRAASDLRIQESAMMSRVLQHLAETRDSMTSVRCFDAVALICRRFYRLVDGSFKPLCAVVTCVRFTRVTGGVAGFCVILASVLTVSLSSTPPSQGGLGLALSLSIANELRISVDCGIEDKELFPPTAKHDFSFIHLPSRGSRLCGLTRRSLTLNQKEKKRHLLSSIYTAGFPISLCDILLPAVLQDVCFVIRAHEKVGVVGRTGAGKSSLILALLRVLRPSKGRVTIDGVDVASVPLRKLRTALTVIPQEPYLMKCSLRENLDPTGSHSDEQVWEALRKAHLADFVSRQPQGLLLEIGDGAENLRVLLLDEATSRMDGDTDRLIQCTLKECFASCTVLTIAHRLNTVLDCDRILVMSAGRVVEFGTVAELAANPDSAFRAMAQAAGIDLSAPRNGFRSSHA